MKRYHLLILVIILIFIITGPLNYAFSKDAIKIAMGYIPNVQFAPYYIAMEKGYFKDEELEVTFDYGMSTDIMTLVAKGVVDFGVSDADQVIIAREKGISVKVVYSMYVKYPVGIVSFKERGITDVYSLKGKRIGTPGPYGSNYIGLQIILNSQGFSLNDVDIEYIGYTQVESLIAGRVDACVVFINNEPVVLKDMGKKVNIIEAHTITPMVSAAIIASDKLIDKKPELVKRFVRAVVRGSDYALENRDDVIYTLKKYIPTLTQENIEINKKVLLASMELWVDEDIEMYGLGYTTKRDWERSIDILYKLGLIKQKVKPEDCFTNDFVR